MAGQTSTPAPIGPHTTVREAVQAYPGIEAVFERHGLGGCGGPNGPVEPIAFFARVHQVDPAGLLRELNAFAQKSVGAVPVSIMAERPRRAAEPYLYALVIALAIAILGGFPLGILAALGGGRDVGLGTRWAAIVQAHGHLQLVGFAGVFIAGVTYHVLPRFKNANLALRPLAIPSVLLLGASAVLRAAAQPWAEQEGVALLLLVSAALEVAGAGMFAAIVGATVAPTQRKNYDRFLFAGTAWFLAASLLNFVVVTEAAGEGASVIAASRGTPLLQMYLLGFIALFILGVSVRVLPHFLSLRPPRVAYLTPALALYTAGLAARVGGGVAASYAGWDQPDWLEAAGVYAMAAAALLFIYALNLHLPSVRDETSDAPGAHEKVIRTAYLWLVIAVAIEAWYATRSLTGDFRPDFLEGGAARHALALGFVTQMVFGVGSRALPAFAGKRLYSARLVTIAWVLLNMAAAQRVVHALFGWGGATFRFDHIAAAGAIGLLAVVVFAYNIGRTLRPPRRKAARVRKEDVMEQSTAEAPAPYAITPQSIVADVIREVPGALDLLIGYGFKPLADPELRARVASSVTLEMACKMHGVDIGALITDLRALSAGAPAGVSTDPKQRILNALRDCHDPEVRVNVVDLGLIYEIEADGESARVAMTLTSPDCPAADELLADVRQRVQQLGFEKVDVRLVREPPWDPSRMTPAARQALGW